LAAYHSEGLFQQIGRIEPLVGVQQNFERSLAAQRKVLSTRQEGILLPFDVTSLATGEPGILALSYRIERLTQVPHNMEFIE
jgi:hypothetical protein